MSSSRDRRGRDDAGVLRLALQIGDDEEFFAGQRIGGIEHARRGRWTARSARARRAPSATRSGQAWMSRAPALRSGRLAADGAAAVSPACLPRQPLRQARRRAHVARGDRSRAKPRQPPLEVGAVAAKPALGDEHRKHGGRRAPARLRAASLTICASRTGSASSRIAWPLAVMRPVAVDRAERRAAARAPRRAPGSGGGSRKASVAGSATPKAAQSSTRPERSASRISGGAKAGSAAVCSARHSRIATPGCVRPARPARWSAEARRHAHGLQPRDAGCRLVFRQPRQAAIDDDAHAVDGDRGLGDRGGQHHLAPPCRRRPDRGVLRLAVEIAVERHDVDVGADAARQPLGGALDLALAGQEGKHAAALARQRLADRLGHRVLDGDRARPLLVAQLDRKAAALAFAAPARRRAAPATRAPSSVADMTSSRRSGRSAALHVERQRQAEIAVERALVEFVEQDRRRCRAVPDRRGSCAARMPSVTTRMRVRADCRLSMRMAIADRAADLFAEQRAMRRAAARAASRRGSSSRICRSPSQAASSSASGTSVVLPAPGGATSTALRPVASACSKLGQDFVTGRLGAAACRALAGGPVAAQRSRSASGGSPLGSPLPLGAGIEHAAGKRSIAAAESQGQFAVTAARPSVQLDPAAFLERARHGVDGALDPDAFLEA